MHAPDDAAEQIAALLDGIVRRQRRASREGFGDTVTHGQFRVLRTLDRAERPLRLSELAAQLGIVPRSATSVVDDLESAGLLARQPDPNDRRATLVALTPAGTQILTTLRAEPPRSHGHPTNPPDPRASNPPSSTSSNASPTTDMHQSNSSRCLTIVGAGIVVVGLVVSGFFMVQLLGEIPGSPVRVDGRPVVLERVGLTIFSTDRDAGAELYGEGCERQRDCAEGAVPSRAVGRRRRPVLRGGSLGGAGAGADACR